MKKLFLITTVILFAACQTPTASTEPKMSNEDISSALKEKAVKLQDAILTQNLEEFNKHVDESISSRLAVESLRQVFNCDAVAAA